MQDRPTAKKLVEAVREFLKEEVLPDLEDSRIGYRMKVAMNGLGILERELAQEEKLLEEEHERLAHLLGEDGPRPARWRRSRTGWESSTGSWPDASAPEKPRMAPSSTSCRPSPASSRWQTPTTCSATDNHSEAALPPGKPLRRLLPGMLPFSLPSRRGC